MSAGTTQLLEEGILLSDLLDPRGIWLTMPTRRNLRRIGEGVDHDP
jgi:hypothetical protein